MGGDCGDSQFWDPLLKKCVECQAVCRQQRVTARCAAYCVSARCKALPAHFFDPLVKRCMNCTKICGRHPAECSQHCQALPPPPPPVTTHKLRPQVTSRAPHPRGPPTGPEDPAVLLYSLLGVCMVLLFSSLSLALVVLMREKKVKGDKRAPAERRRQGAPSAAPPPRQELGFPCVQQGKNSNGFPVVPPSPANRVPSDDSIPTETCVCVHCFPDLKALGPAGDRPFYQPSVSRGAQTRDGGGGPLWSEGSQRPLTPCPKVYADAAVG